jgi:catechol 2,3-dioxygenase-like lactoylglutathione lyase family enzyme
MTAGVVTPCVVKQLLYISRNVRELESSSAFYCERLGFQLQGGPYLIDAARCGLLGLHGLSIRAQRLTFGDNHIELIEVGSHGRPYPPDSLASDLWFQHFALRCVDIHAAYQRLYRSDAVSAPPLAISTPMHGLTGPIVLPSKSGGAIAFKFRDPDGHPLELIQVKRRKNQEAAREGIDHSAIAVHDVRRSIDFYLRHLGMTVTARQTNSGMEQNCLDALSHDTVEVVALAPTLEAGPHLELLGYGALPGRTLQPPAQPHDIASDRLVFACGAAAGTATALSSNTRSVEPCADALLRDPDGHFIVLSFPRRIRQ